MESQFAERPAFRGQFQQPEAALPQTRFAALNDQEQRPAAVTTGVGPAVAAVMSQSPETTLRPLISQCREAMVMIERDLEVRMSYLETLVSDMTSLHGQRQQQQLTQQQDRLRQPGAAPAALPTEASGPPSKLFGAMTTVATQFETFSRDMEPVVGEIRQDVGLLYTRLVSLLDKYVILKRQMIADESNVLASPKASRPATMTGNGNGATLHGVGDSAMSPHLVFARVAKEVNKNDLAAMQTDINPKGMMM